jgi:hypothetical protein
VPTGFDVRLVRYAVGGARQGALHETSFDATQAWGDIPTLSITFSEAVWSQLPSLVEIALEVFDSTISPAGGWVEPDNSRFILTNDDVDQKDVAGIKKMTATGYLQWFLSKLIVFDPADLDDLVEGKRYFETANPGEIVKTMFDEGLAEGWGDDPAWDAPLDYDFTNALDSGGTPWPSDITIGYSPGFQVWPAIANLYDQRMLDFSTTGRTLHLWVPDHGVDRSVGASAVRLKRGITSLPVSRDLNDLITKLRVFGEGGARLSLDNPGAFEGLGALFGAVLQGGVSQVDTMTLLAQAELDKGSEIRRQVKAVLAGAALVHRPHLDFALGDWLSVPLATGSEKMRVFEIVTMKKATGEVEVALVLNDRFLDMLVRLARRTVGIVGGSSAGGSGGIPATDDTRLPKAPTGLVVGSTGYWEEDGSPKSVVEANWTPVTQAVDDVAIGIAQYEMSGRIDDGSTPPSVSVFSEIAFASQSHFSPGVPWLFKVRAQSTSGYWGEWSAEEGVTTAVPDVALDAPASPILATRNSVVVVATSGLFDTDPPTSAPSSFREFRIERASDEAGPYTAVGVLTRDQDSRVFADMEIGDTWWFRFVAVDRLGRDSDPSDPESITVVGVNGADLIVNTLHGNKLIAGTVTVDRLEAGAGGLLDISGNVVTIAATAALAAVADDVETVAGDVSDIDSNLAEMQTFYTFGPDGAVITSPGSDFSQRIAADRTEMRQGATVISYWEAGQMVVPRLVTASVQLAEHQWESAGVAGSVIRALQ